MRPLFTGWMDRITGCDIGPATIRIVELGKFFNKIILLHADEEKLDSGFSPLQSVRLAFRRLYDRCPKCSRDVVIHVEGKGVRHLIADAPLETESLEEWAVNQVMQRLPEGMSADDLAVSYHILAASDDHLKLWITYCQARLITEKLEWMKAAGLEPVGIGGGALDINQAFLISPDHSAVRLQSVVLIRENGIILSVSENAQPVLYDELPLPTAPLDANKILSPCMKRLQETGNLHVERMVWVDARRTDDEESPLEPPDQQTPPIVQESPLSGTVETNSPLSPAFGLAAGLALKRFYPALNTIDLLPRHEKEEARLKTEKRRAVRCIIALGGLFAVLLLTVNLIGISTENRLAASEKKMIEFNDQIHGIELTKKEQNKLIQTLDDMKHLVGKRSDNARLFEEIGRIMPRESWLETFTLEPVFEGLGRDKTRTGDRVIMQGWTLADSRIAGLISNLESSALLGSVRLEERERIPGEEVFKRTGQSHEPVIRFRVTAMVRSSMQTEKDKP